MSDSETVEMIHEDALPGDEHALEPKPEWQPFYPGSGRLVGQPDEVAPSFLFLACEDSRYMSGQVLHPNGGTIVGS